MPQLLPATLSAEAQNLETDRLVKLYVLDCTSIGGQKYTFCSSVDASLDISSLTSSVITATVVTTTDHLLNVGDPVNIAGADQTNYNGDFTVTAVIDAKTFTYSLTSSTTSPATGSTLVMTRLNNTMSFNGEVYSPVAFSATGFEWNGQGTLPLPKIQISNVNKILQAAVRTLGDLRGATFIRIRTFRKHLDDGSDPDPTQIFPSQVFKVNRKTNQNKVFIEFELAASLDQESAMIPGRQMIQKSCSHIYRTWNATTGAFDYTKATCPYTGTTYFTNIDNAISDPSQDQCGKQLSSCKLRFGSNPLPTRAFPGIGGGNG